MKTKKAASHAEPKFKTHSTPKGSSKKALTAPVAEPGSVGGGLRTDKDEPLKRTKATHAGTDERDDSSTAPVDGDSKPGPARDDSTTAPENGKAKTAPPRPDSSMFPQGKKKVAVQE